MQIYIVDDALGAAELSAQLIMEAVVDEGARNLGFATGQTMVPVYEKLIKLVARGNVDMSRAAWRTFNLDEYVGLSGQHPGSFRYFMEHHLFQPLNLEPGQTHFLNGLAQDLEAECLRYENVLHAHPLDLQVLGLGINGHIGFNEPGTPWDSRTHRVRLSAATKSQNRDSFPGAMPQEALTMGIRSIADATRILLVAIGGHKAEAVYRAAGGAKTVDCPASALQDHPHVRLVVDRAAAQLLLSDGQSGAHAEVIHVRPAMGGG